MCDFSMHAMGALMTQRLSNVCEFSMHAVGGLMTQS